MLVADCLGRKRYGSLQGLLGSAAQFGAAFGPELSGLMFDATNSYVRAFQLLALLQAVGAIAAFASVPAEYSYLGDTSELAEQKEQSSQSP
jgi:cyanate permease